MRRALAMAVVALAGCGGLDNEPLRVGVVRGRLSSVDVTSALVAVLGRPDLWVQPPASGDFELRGVPQGEAELVAVASPTLALRVQVSVAGGVATSVGTIVPRPAAHVRLHLDANAYQRLGQTVVRIDGMPVAYAITDDGYSRVGPLPSGCYDLVATTPGFGEVKQEICVLETDELELELELPDPDGSEGHEGCLVSGCLAPYTCRADGSCEP